MANETDQRIYEAMYLVDTGVAGAWDDFSGHVSNILTRYGGEVVGLTRWDERKLAFPVKKQKRGAYALAFFTLTDGDAVAEIERDCQLSDQILRVLITRADHFSVADMRVQLGEDINEEVAKALADERGEEILSYDELEAEHAEADDES